MNIFSTKKNLKNYILLITISLLFIFFFKKLTIINSPFFRIYGFSKSVFENINFFFEKKSVYEKYNEIVRENNILKQQNSLLLSAKDEIEKNKTILSSLSILNRPFLNSKILMTQRSGNEQIMFLNRGYSDGIEKDNIVVFGNYLIGKIYETFPFYSKAIFSSDPRSKISVSFEKSNLIGIANGCGDENTLQVLYLENDPNLTKGLLVYTSGEGLIFPPGLCIGKIEEIIKNGDLYVNLIIKNDLEINNLTNCQIILNKNNIANEKILGDEILNNISLEKKYEEISELNKKIEEIKEHEEIKEEVKANEEKESAYEQKTELSLSEKMKKHVFMVNKIKNIQ